MNLKKVFASVAGVSMLATAVLPASVLGAASYGAELQGAYDYAFANGITTMSSIDQANMYGELTRGQLAKMISNWAEKEGKATVDQTKVCSFSDANTAEGDLATYLTKACQMGLMGLAADGTAQANFRPNDKVTRGEFGTVLSRALWGNKNNVTTGAFYAKHLEALKAAGIMTKIENPTQLEIRGYVMLMLQRSVNAKTSDVDCKDALVVAACALGNCPAACTTTATTGDNTTVKAGDLSVSTKGDSNGKLFVGRPSELDTIALKSSEAVSLSRVVLERVGYSSKDNVKGVRLEDENGAKMTEAKKLDSKGQVKLTIKKDYRTVNGTLNATIVVDTYDTDNAAGGQKALTAGSTVGFKVVEVESTAKNVNIDAKANTYTAIAFDGSKISFTSKPSTKDYNFSAGEMYEVAKFKVAAPEDSSILLRGITLKNQEETRPLDVRKYFDKAEVTVAGQKVEGMKASVNKDDELVISFNDVNVASKAKAEVIVKVSLTDEFDTFGNKIEYKLTDFVAVDGKVQSRVALQGAYPVMSAYTFKGGKIKLANVKLGNVDAAQNSEDVVVAEGTITVNEALKGSFSIDVKGDARAAIKEMTFVVNNEEVDAEPTAVVGDASTVRFNFNNVEIAKSGKIKFLVDVKDANTWDGMSLTIGSFNADSFSELKYDESEKSAKDETSGSISFSKVTIQPAKASLSNKNTKTVEFMNKATNTEVVFDGTYTAKKGDIKLNEFSLEQLVAPYAKKVNVTFHVYVGDMKTAVADAKALRDAANTKYLATNTFDNVLVKAGQSVAIRVEAEVEADLPTATPAVVLGKYELKIWGEDVNGNTPSGEGKAKTVEMSVVDNGSVDVTTPAVKQTLIRTTADAKIAEFVVKPADGASKVDLESIEFKIERTAVPAPAALSVDDITLKVADVEEDGLINAAGNFVYSMNREVWSEGVVVSVLLNDEFAGTVKLSDLKVNTKPQSVDFQKRYVDAAVWVKSQVKVDGVTKYTLGVDKASGVTVKDFTVKYAAKSGEEAKNVVGKRGSFENDAFFNLNTEIDYEPLIDEVSYTYVKNAVETIVVIKKADLLDYFKIGTNEIDLKVFQRN